MIAANLAREVPACSLHRSPSLAKSSFASPQGTETSLYAFLTSIHGPLLLPVCLPLKLP